MAPPFDPENPSTWPSDFDPQSPGSWTAEQTAAMEAYAAETMAEEGGFRASADPSNACQPPPTSPGTITFGTVNTVAEHKWLQTGPPILRATIDTYERITGDDLNPDDTIDWFDQKPLNSAYINKHLEIENTINTRAQELMDSEDEGTNQKGIDLSSEMISRRPSLALEREEMYQVQRKECDLNHIDIHGEIIYNLGQVTAAGSALLADLVPVDDAAYAEAQRIGDQARREYLERLEQQAQVAALNPNIKDQCALLTNMEDLSKLYIAHLQTQAVTGPVHAYPKNGKIIRLQSENSAGIMSKLTGCGYATTYQHFTEKNLSLMTPKIRFWKVVHKGDWNADPVDHPIWFRQDDRVGEDFLNSSIHRGFGVGLESFTWNYEGSNPASARKDVKATLTITANSFNELMKERPAYGSDHRWHKYKIIDLALNPGSRSSTTPEGEIERYKIKVQVGWNPPGSGVKEMFSNITTDVDSLFKCLVETLYLVVVDHDINIDDYGRVKLTIEYRAYMETSIEDPKYNILFPDEELQTTFTNLNEPFTELFSACNKMSSEDIDRLTGVTVDTIEQVQEEYDEAIETLKYRGFQRIVQNIKKNGRLFIGYIDRNLSENLATLSAINKTFTMGGTEDLADALVSLSKSMERQINDFVQDAFSEDYLKNLSEGTLKNFDFSQPGASINLRPIPFFFMGDLIDVVYDYAYEQSFTGNNLKIVLPSFPFRTPEGNIVTTSIAHIPISLDFFTEWYANDAIAKDIKFYPLMDFIRNITRTMVSELLGRECTSRRLDFTVRLQPGFLKAPLVDGKEFFESKNKPDYFFDISEEIDGQSFATGFLSLAGDVDSKDVYDYLIIYPSNTLYLQDLDENGVEIDRLVKDAKNGVVNFAAGSKTGFLKTISFSKNDIPGLREARLERYGTIELSQMANVYNAKLELHGIPGFYPGQRVFVNPFALGLDVPTNHGSPAWSLGIGGYHIIIAVNSTISRGVYTTSLDCRWESADGQQQLFDGETNQIGTPGTDFATLCRQNLYDIRQVIDTVNSQLNILTGEVGQPPGVSTPLETWIESTGNPFFSPFGIVLGVLGTHTED